MTCQRTALLPILSIVKGLMLLIQIIVPILLVVSGIIGLIQLMNNPELKDGTKKIINRFIAAVIVFLIPLLINAFMGLLGESSSFSNCWNEAQEFKIGSEGYTPIDEKKEKKEKIIVEYNN